MNIILRIFAAPCDMGGAPVRVPMVWLPIVAVAAYMAGVLVSWFVDEARRDNR